MNLAKMRKELISEADALVVVHEIPRAAMTINEFAGTVRAGDALMAYLSPQWVDLEDGEVVMWMRPPPVLWV